ncbi:multiple inositol polyphosphate phosphatase 1-like [Plodia interpunctella]|uniref:multiple inositol polyphosphate phosphatase 1-like n=1 Tax=Plodia interpunctella TaxID=58824 RepID=UPI002367AEAC|nr:multiple inositol polyphosphate phosphatase 1-like [Plodia interpunctella]
MYCSSCYWNNYDPYRLFSTKTPYINVRGDIRDSVNSAELQDCKALSIWGIFRHGKRSPGIKFSDNIKHIIAIRGEIIARHEDGESLLCAQDLENLKNWKVNKELFKNLHDTIEEGLSEIAGVGRRLREAFKNLLTDLKPHEYTFRSNRFKYIGKCIDGFLRGLKQPDLKVEYARFGDVMAPFDDCPTYKNMVKRNDTTFAQARNYLTSPEYLRSKARIQNRTGLILTNEQLTSLYDLCRYAWSALENIPSPWCALFDEEDLKIQEYYEDLRLYYRNGYGNPWNVEFGQIPLADLLRKFKLQKQKPHIKITAYFTHATMLSMTYSALGLFKDDNPLTADYRDDNRKWRTSQHAPFAGNLIAVLNKCQRFGNDKFMVAFYMNEKPFEGICKHGVCTWEEFEEMLRPTQSKTFLNVCNKKI